MRQPNFWSQRSSFLSYLLLPLTCLWLLGTAIRGWIYTRKEVAIPVISVGNVNVGGTGKTPLTIALLQKLQEKGHNPHVITRGYGGNIKGPELVNEKQHTINQVGDEALLLSSFCKTWVARDRYEGARKAIQEGASIIILDDGHQNLTLVPSHAIVVVDAGNGFGNQRVIPSGPLREPLAGALRRTNLIVVVGTDTQAKIFTKQFGAVYDVPIIQAQLTVLEHGLSLNNQNVVAFAGLGNPLKFKITLQELGAKVNKFVPLGDHEIPSESFLYRLEKEAKKKSSLLVTTEKDAVRLNKAWKKKILTVPVRLKLNDWDLLERLIDMNK